MSITKNLYLHSFFQVRDCSTITPKNRIDDLLSKLSNSVQYMIKQSKEFIELNIQELAKYSSELKWGAYKIMDKDELLWSVTINDLKKQASEKNIDISSCLENDENSLNQLLPVNKKQITDCLNDVSRQANDSVQTAYQQVSFHI